MKFTALWEKFQAWWDGFSLESFFDSLPDRFHTAYAFAQAHQEWDLLGAAYLILFYIAIRAGDPMLRTVSLTARFFAACAGAYLAYDVWQTGLWDMVTAFRAGDALFLAAFAVPALLNKLRRG